MYRVDGNYLGKTTLSSPVFIIMFILIIKLNQRNYNRDLPLQCNQDVQIHGIPGD